MGIRWSSKNLRWIAVFLGFAGLIMLTSCAPKKSLDVQIPSEAEASSQDAASYAKTLGNLANRLSAFGGFSDETYKSLTNLLNVLAEIPSSSESLPAQTKLQLQAVKKLFSDDVEAIKKQILRADTHRNTWHIGLGLIVAILTLVVGGAIAAFQVFLSRPDQASVLRIFTLVSSLVIVLCSATGVIQKSEQEFQERLSAFSIEAGNLINSAKSSIILEAGKDDSDKLNQLRTKYAEWQVGIAKVRTEYRDVVMRVGIPRL